MFIYLIKDKHFSSHSLNQSTIEKSYYWKKGTGFQKELMVAIGYGTGVFLAPVAIYTGVIDWVLIIFYLQFVTLAMLNLLIFSIFDAHIDKVDGHVSMVGFWGEGKMKGVIWILTSSMVFSIVGTIIKYAGIVQIIKVEGVYLIMLLLLVSLLLWKDFFAVNERFRWVGDGIFFVPIIYLLI